MMSGIRLVVAFMLLLGLAACGGGGGDSSTGSSSSAATVTTPALTNFTTVTVDNGPAALSQAGDGYLADNIAYVSVTLCIPGTTTCQTIDHVQLDTGSVGLRILNSALNSQMQAALPQETDTNSNPVGECYTFVDGYVFGSVRRADFQIGGETVDDMPLQLVGGSGQFATVPSECSSGGGANLHTITDLGANGILGIGVTATDCGSYCTIAGGYSAAIYYDCPAAGCDAIIARAAATSAPFQQLPNPVAAMSVDNNGTILTLPTAPSGGEASMTGTLYFGIGTQTNNKLGSATVLTTTTSSSAAGAGFLSAVYGGRTLRDSFIDSGSNAYYFVDNSIPECSSADATGFYCPTSPLALDPRTTGQNDTSADAAFTLQNAQTLFATNDAVLPGVGANPDAFSDLTPYQSSFDFGLPFFFGRSVYTAIEGRTAGGATGPYVAY
ncbi:MAG: DUF3443 family protein [Alphaproteobacteria bacterium]|nr:DUF3443 family protein [Alphaproteobacteria bacterium]